jgi:hypothetical protein
MAARNVRETCSASAAGRLERVEPPHRRQQHSRSPSNKLLLPFVHNHCTSSCGALAGQPRGRSGQQHDNHRRVRARWPGTTCTSGQEFGLERHPSTRYVSCCRMSMGGSIYVGLGAAAPTPKRKVRCSIQVCTVFAPL